MFLPHRGGGIKYCSHCLSVWNYSKMESKVVIFLRVEIFFMIHITDDNLEAILLHFLDCWGKNVGKP